MGACGCPCHYTGACGCPCCYTSSIECVHRGSLTAQQTIHVFPPQSSGLLQALQAFLVAFWTQYPPRTGGCGISVQFLCSGSYSELYGQAHPTASLRARASAAELLRGEILVVELPAAQRPLPIVQAAPPFAVGLRIVEVAAQREPPRLFPGLEADGRLRELDTSPNLAARLRLVGLWRGYGARASGPELGVRSRLAAGPRWRLRGT